MSPALQVDSLPLEPPGVKVNFFFFLIRASLVFVSGTQVPGAFDFLICKACFAQGLSLVLFQNDCALIFLSQEEWTVGDHTNKFKWEAATIA